MRERVRSWRVRGTSNLGSQGKDRAGSPCSEPGKGLVLVVGATLSSGLLNRVAVQGSSDQR